jgi:hypothetical protein
LIYGNKCYTFFFEGFPNCLYAYVHHDQKAN